MDSESEVLLLNRGCSRCCCCIRCSVRKVDLRLVSEKLRYTLLMRANKPETAVQSSASFFSWHHIV